jgi:hypothetical protein
VSSATPPTYPRPRATAPPGGRPLAARGMAPPVPAPAEPEPTASPGQPPSDPYRRTDLGCADGTDAASLDRFFADKRGPVLGWDYPHVQPLPDGRVLWLFQDTFVGAGRTQRLADAVLVRNAVAVQAGRCFTLLHRGRAEQPLAFEGGDGEVYGRRWWWPLGSAVHDDVVRVFWVEMIGDPTFPPDGWGLPWSPGRTWLATYRASTLERLAFQPAPDEGVHPVYGYAVESDGTHTYLFANSYEQNLQREGGWFGAHSADAVYVARVPKGRLDQRPLYWDGTHWVGDRARAVPISKRFAHENPMQPRFLDGRWISVTKADGFYGGAVVVDVAPAAQGPWQPVAAFPAIRRRDDTRLTTYHAHAMPWRAADGRLVVALSQNDARALWAPASQAWMYRPLLFSLPWPPTTAPPATTTTTEAPTTVPPPTTTRPPATTAKRPRATTTVAATTTRTTARTTTTVASTTTTSSPPPTTTSTSPTTTTTVPGSTTTTTAAP